MRHEWPIPAAGFLLSAPIAQIAYCAGRPARWSLYGTLIILIGSGIGWLAAHHGSDTTAATNAICDDLLTKR